MNLRRIGLGLFLILASCTQTKFASEKGELLASQGAFTTNLSQPGADGNGIKNNGDATGNLVQGGGDATGNLHQPDGTDSEIDLLLMCSDRRSGDNANFKRAYDENLPVELLIGTNVCTNNKDEIKAIIQKKKFTLGDAQRLCPALVPASGQWANVTIGIDGVPYNSMRGTITVLYALNTQTDPPSQAADALCDKRSSPLVIHLTSDTSTPQPIALSSQADGVLFDLLGARNNHLPVQISWFTNQDYGLLALPDTNGEVNSIDQLFGDNTVGPDGRFSDNGYAALAKYDGTTSDGAFQVAKPDGIIDRHDPVFSRLRIWVDKNLDGKAQPEELIPLRKARISYIDLKYSTAYAETDQYGNQTLMKSVVGYWDGSLDLIFDLWFAYKF
ncbi:MAG: hypothetical protein ACXVA9_08885 [Bdellovibrionales bacterium]